MAVSKEDRQRGAGGGGGADGAARRPFKQHGKSHVSANATRYSKEGRMAAKDAIARGEGYQGKKFIAKQKRWEKKGGGGPAPDAASAAARGTGKGFQIGPKPQKGIYTGKADKIKAGLIKNAKIKQAYAKVLKQEKKKGAADAGVDDADEAMSASSGEEEERDMQAEPSAPSASRQNKGKRRADPDAMREDVENPFEASTSRPALRKRKSSELEHNPENMLDSSDEEEVLPAPGPDHLRGATAPASSAPEPYVHPSRQAGDASGGKGKGKIRGRQAAPLPSQKQQQQLSADGQPKQKRQRLSEDEIQLLRDKREADSKAWAKKTGKGQPNLGSRMGVLLGKIERKAGFGSR